jgi:hypothetical protein
MELNILSCDQWLAVRIALLAEEGVQLNARPTEHGAVR